MASKAATRARSTRRRAAKTLPHRVRQGKNTNRRSGRTLRVKAASGTMRAKTALTSRPAAPAPRTARKPLGKRELAEFRKMLRSERDRLTEELEAIEEHLPEVEQVSVEAGGGYDEDLADVASDTFEREKGFAIENSVQELLEQVEEALERMKDGTYGICEMCSQQIHPDRLRALPYARLCINCKAREEQAIPR
ncbi:MAG TPA: TraR/DksA C4-type zinc finger protein [bacterium]|nr:TraR/DksA C4-type zinc finger protein [bacterium]